MRAWPCVLALGALLALARPARADQPIGFDHPIHEGKVVVQGGAEVGCASCHPITARGALIGRPDHRACFGACHGPAPTRAAPDLEARARVCQTCHAPTALAARRPTVAYPPYALDADFGITFGHRHHAAADCTTCHAVPGGPARATAVHGRCATCHTATAAPRMPDCGGCHAAGFGANVRPKLVARELAVGAAFDHGRHRRRAPIAAALACATCHQAIAATDDLELPAPTVATCSGAGCHDGQAAFATTTACTRCHTRAPTDPFAVARPLARFGHAGHDARTPLAACTACHRLDGDRQVRTAGHDACAGCHAADFGARAPTICGACHGATEPWRHLVADRAPPPRSEFGVEFDHRRHAAQPCARCHVHDTAAAELRPPRGHDACTGAGCHAGAGGPAPALAACAACHGLGRADARDLARTSAPWSVRARFRHAPHRTDGDAALACTACHGDVATAASIAAIGGPPKAACADCHDGARAFRMTGHGCARCHGQ
ncbi:MAG: cytochrome c3 family protein [Myxococcales bacterium]|nr:cytochrome c3 family protein [Myxococcales bacterium]